MDIKTKIFKRKSGKSKDAWVLRIYYFDELAGKECVIERKTEKRSDAVDKVSKLVDEIKKTHGQIQTGDKMTFNNLADICEKNFYAPAVIVEGRKISGVRSHNTAKIQLNNLKSFFGSRLIRHITTESLTHYKIWRLEQGSANKTLKTKREIKLATVNRELSAMRRIMRFAYGKGWVLKDIFFNAKVIETSAELERKRLLTLEEERNLLAVCQGTRTVKYERRNRLKPGEMEEIEAIHDMDNPQLKAILLLAIDSGLRRGEILKLRWSDLDFDANVIRIIGTHTKTERERLVPFTERTKAELENIKNLVEGEKPFNFKDFKRSFATAKRLAGIDDLHFHDLRRTAITRWLQQGTSLPIAGKFAGHSQLQTTMKHYTATDAGMIREMNERMNAFNSQIDKALESELVN